MSPAIEARVARILSRCSSALTAGQLAALSEIVEYELTGQAMDMRNACAGVVTGILRENPLIECEKLVLRSAHKAILKTPLV